MYRKNAGKDDGDKGKGSCPGTAEADHGIKLRCRAGHRRTGGSDNLRHQESSRKTPPELAADVIDRGIILTGGGAYLNGLDRLIIEETEINAVVAESASECVALGTGIALESLDKLKETGAIYSATRSGYKGR